MADGIERQLGQRARRLWLRQAVSKKAQSYQARRGWLRGAESAPVQELQTDLEDPGQRVELTPEVNNYIPFYKRDVNLPTAEAPSNSLKIQKRHIPDEVHLTAIALCHHLPSKSPHTRCPAP